MDPNQYLSGFVKECTVSATLVALSHSIRQGPDAHTGAECVLRATYQERGTSGETGEGKERPGRVTDERQKGPRGGDTKTKRGESEGEG